MKIREKLKKNLDCKRILSDLISGLIEVAVFITILKVLGVY